MCQVVLLLWVGNSPGWSAPKRRIVGILPGTPWMQGIMRSIPGGAIGPTMAGSHCGSPYLPASGTHPPALDGSISGRHALLRNPRDLETSPPNLVVEQHPIHEGTEPRSLNESVLHPVLLALYRLGRPEHLSSNLPICCPADGHSDQLALSVTRPSFARIKQGSPPWNICSCRSHRSLSAWRDAPGAWQVRHQERYGGPSPQSEFRSAR